MIKLHTAAMISSDVTQRYFVLTAEVMRDCVLCRLNVEAEESFIIGADCVCKLREETEETVEHGAYNTALQKHNTTFALTIEKEK
jgi:hypothetical protein